MDDALARRLQASIGSAFTLERELGGGGMARVFVAREGALERLVVIKVLDLEVSAEASAERFRREIKLIATLQHPHIVPVLSAGGDGGLLWYAMPFVSGESLRARLIREGALPMADALRIMREVLDALGSAHDRGIVHRDIKPENILLEGRHAVVADFGIAKAFADAGLSSGLTSVGMALGTPAYMAPEQALADPTTNHRADLYASGAVLYEMLVGAPPFSGNAQAVVAAHLTAPVPRVEDRRGDVPAPVALLVQRLLAKNAAERPQSAHEALAVLESVTTPGAFATGADAVAARSASTAAGRDPAVASEPAGARRGDVEANPRAHGEVAFGARRWRRAVVAGAVVILAAAALFALRRPSGPVVVGADVIAVMPLSSTGDSALGRLGRDLVVTLSTNLDGVGSLRAVDAMSVLMRSQKLPQPLPLADARALAADLGSRSVLHGSLVPNGAGVRADLALYRVAGGDAIARASVTASRDDIRALTDSITAQLLRQVWRAGNPPSPFLANVATGSPDALRAFLDGERAFEKLRIGEALAAYARAFRADSMFAQAYFRADFVRSWALSEPDPEERRRVIALRERLAPRDREWVEINRVSPKPFAERLVEGRALAARYPDYALAQYSVADAIIHSGPTYGVAVTDALPYLDRVDALAPDQPDNVAHRWMVAQAVGDTASLRKTARSVAFGDSGKAGAQGAMMQAMREATSQGRAPSAEELRRVLEAGVDAARETPTASWQYLGGVYVRGVSGASTDSALRLLEDRGTLADLRLQARVLHATVDASRGRFASAVRTFGEVVRTDVPVPVALGAARTAAVAAWLGLIPASRADSVVADARLKLPRLSGYDLAELSWLDGLAGIAHGDSARAARAALSITDTTPASRGLAPSLRALWRLRSTAQADSLIALEDRILAHGAVATATLPVHRLAIGRALVKAGRPADAERYLRWPDAVANGLRSITVLSAFGPIVNYERAVAAQAAGDPRTATRLLQAFLSLVDAPDAAVEPLVADAKARLTKLTGDVRK